MVPRGRAIGRGRRDAALDPDDLTDAPPLGAAAVMSEWRSVVANGLWITGLSVVLAGFSYHDWLARASRRPHRDLFALPTWQLPWRLGMCLVCVGWGLSQASRRWEALGWMLLGAWFAVNLIRLLVRLSRSSNDRGSH